jgi:mRNA interferase RelE/StbE
VYEVLIEAGVERELKRLSNQDFKRIVGAMRGLADNPRPSGCRKLVGSDGDWRVRIGDYRVLYEIIDTKQTVRILHVKHRREAYR